MNFAVAENPESDNLCSFLGLLYFKIKEAEQAKKWVEKALELNPENLRARDILNKLEAM